MKKNNKKIKLNYYQNIKKKELLSKRYIIEHYFSLHKCQHRLNVRYDRKISLFTFFKDYVFKES